MSEASKGYLLDLVKGERAVKGDWSLPIKERPLVDADDLDKGGIKSGCRSQ